MSKPKSLTRRQRAVIEELFTSETDERTVLAKHKVSRDLYSRWLTDDRFCEAFETRIAQAHHTARILLARAAPEAAKTLIDLTKCSKEETARKACLDIVAAPTASGTDETPRTAPEPDPTTELPPETATRLLAALADSCGASNCTGCAGTQGQHIDRELTSTLGPEPATIPHVAKDD